MSCAIVVTVSACGGFFLKKRVQDLRSPDAHKRQRAIDAIVGDGGGNRIIEDIAEVLKDDFPEIRIAAIECLARLKDENTIPHLLNMENDTNKDVRRAMVVGFAYFGQRGIPELNELMSHGHKEDIRAYAAWTLGQIGDSAVFDSLKAVLLNDRAPDIVRAGAARAIGCLKHPEAQNLLLKVVDDESVPSTARCGAADGLVANYGSAHDNPASPTLDRLRGSASEEAARYCAAKAYAELYEPTNLGRYCKSDGFVAEDVRVIRRNF